MSKDLSMYDLTRDWWNFCFENPEKIKPIHSALYLFAIEHCNRLAWKSKFGLPTTMAMEAIGVKSYNTYINALRDLVDWKFIKMIEKSKNQHSSNIVALSKNDKAHNKALDKAMYKHATKHGSKQRESTDSINIPDTNIPDTSLPSTDHSAKIENFDDAKEVAEYLLKAICDTDPTHRYNNNPPSLNGWIKDIDLAIRRDGREREHLLHMIEYIYYKKHQSANWWQGKIESGKKLRDKFDTIKNQILKTKANGKQKPNIREFDHEKHNAFIEELFSSEEQL